MTRLVLANVLLAITVSGAGSLSASPQVPSASPSPTKQAELSPSPPNEAVMLDVIALGRIGQAIADLKADEFHLRVNKQEQKVDSVTYSDSGPLALGFVFDISGSQRGNRARGLELKEAGDLLHRVWQPGDESFIAGFDDEVIVLSKPSRDLSDADKGLSTVAIAVPRGSTGLYDAICAIKVDRVTRLQRRRLVLVFSDFEDNASRISLHGACECAQKAGVRVYPVLLAEEFVPPSSTRTRRRAREAARELAEQTGGEVLVPKSKKDLSEIFANLGGHLRNGYAVYYSLAGRNAQTEPEKIELTTSRKDAKLLYAKEIYQR